MKESNRLKRSIYLTPTIAERADELAAEMGLTFSSMLIMALNDFLKNYERYENAKEGEK